MVLDLDRELRRYTEYLDELVEPVSLPVFEPHRAQGRRARTGRLVPAFGAALLLILAIGLLVVLNPFGSDDPPFVEEPTTVSAPVPSVPTTLATTPTIEATPQTTQAAPVEPLPDPPSISWTRIADPSIFGGERAQNINAVTAVSDCGTEGCGPVDALIAVGSDRSGADDFTVDAAVWVSADGLSWRRIPHDEFTLGGDRHEEMRDVASNGDRVVAVGSVLLGRYVDSPGDRAAIWLSEDSGNSWRRVPFETDPPVRALSTVVPFESGFLVGGNGLWMSEHGETWTPVGLETSFGYVHKIIPTEVGWLALSDRGVWMSPNGHDWSWVASVPELADVADVGDGLVGFGEIFVGDMGSRPAVWQSANGLEWTVLNDNLTGRNTIHFHEPRAIEPVGEWLLAVGNQQTRAFWSRPRLWMSPDDGRSWLELDVSESFGKLYDPGSGVSDVVILTDGTGRQTIVMVGVWGGTAIDGTTPEDQYDGAVWIGTIED